MKRIYCSKLNQFSLVVLKFCRGAFRIENPGATQINFPGAIQIYINEIFQIYLPVSKYCHYAVGRQYILIKN
jgi:hypothetical protein